MGNIMLCGKLCDNVDIKQINKDLNEIKTNHLHHLEIDVRVIQTDIKYMKESISEIRNILLPPLP